MSEGTITKRLNNNLTSLEAEFKGFYTYGDFEEALNNLKNSWERSSKHSMLRTLYNMLDACNISYERNQPYEYYERLIQDNKDSFFSSDESEKLGEKIMRSLYKKFVSYPSPEEFMLRIVNRLIGDEWEEDTLRLRILKQFIHNGNYLVDAGVSGRKKIKEYIKEKVSCEKVNDQIVIENIDDNVFSLLDIPKPDYEGMTAKEKRAAKDKFKAEKDKVELLKVADDLASGKFRTNNATKKYLYLFAMAFDMTFNIDGFVDEKTDIEKNLFQDYYCNNVIRYYSEAYKENATSFEADPSGIGVNFKNFAEVIYLYYINSEMKGPQKIKQASRMIEECKKHGNKKSSAPESSDETILLRANVRTIPGDGFDVLADSVLEKNEKDFEDYIINNYNCCTKVGNAAVGVMEVGYHQNTPAEKYAEILRLMEDDGISNDEIVNIWFEDLDSIDSNKKYSDLDKEKFDNLVTVLKKVNSFLLDPVGAGDEITRSSMIATFHKYYIGMNCDGVNDFKVFSDVFYDFKSLVDGYLIESGFQEFSGRNIFDIIVAFSAYAALNM